MMLREMNRRTLLSLVALVILVILSAATLDYSGLSTFS
ncbi:TPA: phosphonate ABC transporter, permease protein PhnE, partial [Enterococcus faecium]|nr:phosphonate ABC transporter, permease protein PhnE [Enterococcus faecium]